MICELQQQNIKIANPSLPVDDNLRLLTTDYLHKGSRSATFPRPGDSPSPRRNVLRYLPTTTRDQTNFSPFFPVK